jgi:lysine/arginine/ornithine transport system substrate-binding protein
MRLILAAVAMLVSLGVARADDTVLRWGTEPADAPFEYKDGQGNLKGAEIELGNQMCVRMGVKCVWVTQDFDSLIPALNAHKIDAIISQMSVTPDRRKAVDFTDLVTGVPARLVARKGSKLTDDPATLKGTTIGVQSGTTHERYVTERLRGIADVKVYQRQDEAFLDLQADRIDATLCDQALGFDWLQKDGKGEFDFVGKTISDPEIFGDGTAIAVRKGDKATLDMLNKALASMVADGSLEAVYNQYFPFSVRP